MTRVFSRRALVPFVLGAIAVGCADPVHDNEVAALGPEPAGQRPGPTHRPGQPCLVCHGGSGPGGKTFVAAGTIYQVPYDPSSASPPQPGATVTLTDANEKSFTATANDVGNFYVTDGEWSPTFPLRVHVDVDQTRAPMHTLIGRDGSCATCHYDPPGPASRGHVYVYTDPSSVPGASP